MQNINSPLVYQKTNIDAINAQLERLGTDDVLTAINWKSYLAIVTKHIPDPEPPLVTKQSLQQLKLLPDRYLEGKLSEKQAQTFWNTIGKNNLSNDNSNIR